MRKSWPLVLAIGLWACASEPDEVALDAAPDLDAGEAQDVERSPDAEPIDAGLVDAAEGSEGDVDAAPLHAELVLPAVIDLPYVVAGAGGSVLQVQASNPGNLALSGLTISLEGPPSFALIDPPFDIPAGGTASFSVGWTGASVETIAEATLVATSSAGNFRVPVFAVAGAPDLPASTWEHVFTIAGANQGNVAGNGTTMGLPTNGRDVRVFVPTNYVDLGQHDFVLHFHGFNTTVASTLASHHYEQQLWASGGNAVLVVPQGPINMASGDFGLLMTPAGTAALLQQVLVLLYRDNLITHPRLGELVLTAHSGGYQAVALNIDPSLPVHQVHLFDALYGYSARFEAFVLAGGRLRSNYTSGGGTLDNNQALAASLSGQGVSVASAPTHRALLGDGPLISFADSSHEGSTRLELAYADWLRFGLRHSVAGARIELRRAIAANGTAQVDWIAPKDDRITGFLVEGTSDGVNVSTLARVPASEDHVQFTFSGGAKVSVRGEMSGSSSQVFSSHYRMDDGVRILVVDHFDRRVDGGWENLGHDFSARIGQAAGGAVSIAHRAIEEDNFDLSPYELVIWVLGDQSVADRTFSPAERTAVEAYLAGGGRLLVTGSEVGYDLGGQGTGPTFLSTTLGASYVADSSGSFSIEGVGPLAGLASFDFNVTFPYYQPLYPDVLGTASGSVELLHYGNGQTAAVGQAGRVAVVGFPIESIEDDAERMALVQALLGFLGL